jgi:hypothetical protein
MQKKQKESKKRGGGVAQNTYPHLASTLHNRPGLKSRCM